MATTKNDIKAYVRVRPLSSKEYGDYICLPDHCTVNLTEKKKEERKTTPATPLAKNSQKIKSDGMVTPRKTLSNSQTFATPLNNSQQPRRDAMNTPMKNIPHSRPISNPMERNAPALAYQFDRVFGPTANTEEVFSHTTESFVQEILDGISCTCIAYGTTGSGKTHTMVGNLQSPGLMRLTLDKLFQTMQDDGIDFDVQISYIEVYNEKVRDLLNNNSILDMSMYALSRSVESTSEAMNVLEEGNKIRAQSATEMNAQSSRSHAILQIQVKTSYEGETRTATLTLADLAGSEGISENHKESASINTSLLVFRRVVVACSSNEKPPFRDSKLTKILKESFVGNCKTIIIANVSPSDDSFSHTKNTLELAAKSKKISTTVSKNITIDMQQTVTLHETHEARITELEQENSKLKNSEEASKMLLYSRIEYLEQQNRDLRESFECKLSELREKNDDLSLEVKMLKYCTNDNEADLLSESENIRTRLEASLHKLVEEKILNKEDVIKIIAESKKPPDPIIIDLTQDTPEKQVPKRALRKAKSDAKLKLASYDTEPDPFWEDNEKVDDSRVKRVPQKSTRREPKDKPKQENIKNEIPRTTSRYNFRNQPYDDKIYK
eukprot:TRINITY_DN1680_c0_g1_i2.p1 TRINITY_DN1680_c0_g1~~TRINITY_DN1680_c0_g1_i2.p1  ORF type:complete len:610 (-),score=81.44 TRINITY_DN1680_c0_g1_i2:22-1851(-)